MNSARQSVIAQQNAEWNRMTRNIGKGLGKTERQIRMQENKVSTRCYKNFDTVICDSQSY